ncbi:MAG: glutathione binding-like protein [Acinetobacter sp.]|uniref:glutathione binding-like protein n=1 Tax=Acinetobacter sp. TaxID=472 RepID=UPI00262B7E18|nr:glutathione binding-like protein [Acinetobacter sp.]MDD2944350.1 glutathione binding-like protein [Acinetobacter sp.]
MILHHLQNSRSQRIVWLFEELNLEYEIAFYTLETSKDKKLKYPTLDIQENKHRLTESSAIAEFMCDGQQRLTIEKDNLNYWDFCFYKNYADASLMPNLALKQIFQQIKIQTPLPVRFIPFALQKAFNGVYINPELKKQLDQIDGHLSEHTWIAGKEFSYADILLWFPLHCAEFAYPYFSEYKNLNRYLKQIGDRTAFKTAIERGQWSSELFKKYWEVTQK